MSKDVSKRFWFATDECTARATFATHKPTLDGVREWHCGQREAVCAQIRLGEYLVGSQFHDAHTERPERMHLITATEYRRLKEAADSLAMKARIAGELRSLDAAITAGQEAAK